MEATCEEGTGFDHHNEIIEFPVILIDGLNGFLRLYSILLGQSMAVRDTFHRYVRPLLKPELSKFCTDLTGISQEIVDNADTFDVVYGEFKEWLQQYDTPPYKECCFCTDGPWDLRDFMEKEFTYYGYTRYSIASLLISYSITIYRPEFMWKIIDVRKLFKQTLDKGGNLSDMLSILGMSFTGREHSGIGF